VAQDLRARQLIPSCALLLAAACSDAAFDPAKLDAAAVPDAVLAHCHGALRGSMDRVSARVTDPSGAEWQVHAKLPGILRAQKDATVHLLAGSGLRSFAGDRELPPDAGVEQALTELRTVLDAAALGPLYRTVETKRVDARTFHLKLTDGEALVLLRTDDLRPEAFRLHGGEVHVTEWLRTSTTWVPRELRIGNGPRWTVHFQLSDVEWAKDFFEPPAAAAPSPRPSVRMPGNRPEPRPAMPVRDENRALRWVVVDDPGTWELRAAAYRTRHDVLVEQDQQIAGFASFFTEGGRKYMAVPFRQRPEGRAFEAPAGWELRNLPRTDVLLVFPDAGDYDQKVARGTELLQQALADQGLEAAGPIVAQPYFHLQEGLPPAERLAAPVVRMTVAVQ
jgi:hypothetical protein